MKLLTKPSIILASLLLPLASLLAETGPLGFGPGIVTQDLEGDRPDITEGTQTITKGHIQLEAGYTYVYDDELDVKTREHSFPEILLRLGLLDDLELRIAWLGYSDTNIEEANQDTDVDGISDVNIGIKHKMYEASAFTPSLSFIFETSLPTGDSEVGSDDLQPSFKLLWAYDIPKTDTSIAGNFNFDFPVEDNQRYYSQGVAVTIAYSPGMLGYYLEYFGEFPSSDAPDSSSIHLANAGLTIAINNNAQLDLRAGAGLNPEAPDFFTGVGLVLRK